MDINERIQKLEKQIEQVEYDIEDLDDERRDKERELDGLESELCKLELERDMFIEQEAEKHTRFIESGGVYDSTDENQNSFF